MEHAAIARIAFALSVRLGRQWSAAAIDCMRDWACPASLFGLQNTHDEPQARSGMEKSESQRSTVSADLECTDVALAGSSTPFVGGAFPVVAGAGRVREGSDIIRRRP